MRSVPEWIARNDDAAIPDRVKERIAAKAKDACVSCKRPIGGKLKPQFDHVIPLILGGQHRENNIQLLCNECHGEKTKLDVRLKAKVIRIRKKHLGISKPKRTIPGRKFDGTPIPSRMR